MQLGDFFSQLLTRLKLLAPAAQLLTQPPMLWLCSQLLLHLLQTVGQLLALHLTVGEQRGAMFTGLPGLFGNALLNLALFGAALTLYLSGPGRWALDKM